MKKKFHTDSIGIEIEIDEKTRTLKRIEIMGIDTEVFPALAVEDKTKMDWFVDALSRQIRAALSDPRFQEKQGGAGVQQGEKQRIICPACGNAFDAKQPCCNVKTSQEQCPRCQSQITVRWE